MWGEVGLWGVGTELNSLARSPRLLFDESKSRLMQVARGRWDVFLLMNVQWRVGGVWRAGGGWGGCEFSQFCPLPLPPPICFSSWRGTVGVVYIYARKPRMTTFVSELWRLDRSTLYFTTSHISPLNHSTFYIKGPVCFNSVYIYSTCMYSCM